jgi:hypothetical protein
MKVIKYVDSSSPKIMLSCCDGKHFGEATLTVRKAGGDSPALQPVGAMTIALGGHFLTFAFSIALYVLRPLVHANHDPNSRDDESPKRYIMIAHIIGRATSIDTLTSFSPRYARDEHG